MIYAMAQDLLTDGSSKQTGEDHEKVTEKGKARESENSNAARVGDGSNSDRVWRWWRQGR
jgi:hypothetical protein